MPRPSSTLRRNQFFAVGTLLAGSMLGGCFGFGGGAELSYRAEARVIETAADLVGGPGAAARIGDIVVENEHVRFVIAAVDDQAGPDAWGGTLIDLDARRLPMGEGFDAWGTLVPLHNFGRTMRPESVEIVDDGRATGRVIVRVKGTDALLPTLDLAAEFAAAFDGGGLIPAEIRPEQAVALEIQTDYILRPGDRGVMVETRYINRGSSPVDLVVGDLLSMQAEAAPFVAGGQGIAGGLPSRGFGWGAALEPGYNRVEFLAWDAPGVAYLYGQRLADVERLRGNTSCVRVRIGAACFAGVDLGMQMRTLVGAHWEPGSALLRVPPRGDGLAVWRRWIMASDEGIAGAARGWLEARGEASVPVEIRAAGADGSVLADADIAVLARHESGVQIPWAHTRSDRDGMARVWLWPGDHRLAVDRAGHLSTRADGSPLVLVIEGVVEGGRMPTAIPAELGAAGEVEFYTRDDRNEALPARIWILGQDPSPGRLFAAADGLRTSGAAGEARVSPFRDYDSDALPAMPAGLTATTLSDRDGTPLPADLPIRGATWTDSEGIAALDLEPGEYWAVAAHGFAHAAAARRFEVRAGERTRVLFDLPQVVDSFGWAAFDPELHSRDSAESGLAPARRALAAAAAGLDAAVLAQSGAAGLPGDGAAEAGVAQRLRLLGGQTAAIAGYGRFAAFPMAATTSPQRQKPTPAEGESIRGRADHNGVATWGADLLPLPPAALEAALDGRADQGIQLLQSPRAAGPWSWFDVLDLDYDWDLGYEPGNPTAGAAQPDPAAVGPRLAGERGTFHDGFDLIQIADGRTGQREAWRGLNDAFALWNLGRPIALAGASAARGLVSPPAGNIRTWVFLTDVTSEVIAPADAAFNGQLLDALAAGRTWVSNGPWMDFVLTGRLLATQGAVTTVVQEYGPARPGDLVSVNPGLFPSGADMALEVTLSVRIQSPLWAPVDRIEWFRNADVFPGRSLVIADASGAELSPLAASSVTLAAPDLAAARVTATVRYLLEREPALRTTGGERYDFERNWTFTIDDTELRAGQDLWFSARATGSTSSWPVVVDRGGAALPMAIASPIFLDLRDGGSGDFDTDFVGPCERPGGDCSAAAP